MSRLLITIAAVVLVGCGPAAPDFSIHEAAEDGNIEAVKKHLAAGTDVDARDVEGETPLRCATIEGHKETVELLIAAGVDVNAKIEEGGSYKGVTPLDLAISRKQTETTDLLRKHGGKTSAELKAAGN